MPNNTAFQSKVLDGSVMVPSTKSGRKIQIGFDTYQTNSDNIREMSNHSPIIRIRIEESIF